MLSCLLLTATLGQAPAKVPDAVEKDALSATIRVSTGTTEGSGVVISRVGVVSYALTAAHVVQGRDKVSVFPLTEAPGMPALETDVVTRTSIAGADLAVLRIQDPAGRVRKAIEVAEKTRTAPFAAFSIGLPGTDRRTIRSETAVSAPNVKKENETARFWKCSDVSTEGRSGGPLVDASGKLIGICSGSDEKSGYYTHMDGILEIVRSSGLTIYPK
jgi:S1-C subfamily serine protease